MREPREIREARKVRRKRLKKGVSLLTAMAMTEPATISLMIFFIIDNSILILLFIALFE